MSYSGDYLDDEYSDEHSWPLHEEEESEESAAHSPAAAYQQQQQQHHGLTKPKPQFKVGDKVWWKDALNPVDRGGLVYDLEAIVYRPTDKPCFESINAREAAIHADRVRQRHPLTRIDLQQTKAPDVNRERKGVVRRVHEELSDFRSYPAPHFSKPSYTIEALPESESVEGETPGGVVPTKFYIYTEVVRAGIPENRIRLASSSDAFPNVNTDGTASGCGPGTLGALPDDSSFLSNKPKDAALRLLNRPHDSHERDGLRYGAIEPTLWIGFALRTRYPTTDTAPSSIRARATCGFLPRHLMLQRLTSCAEPLLFPAVFAYDVGARVEIRIGSPADPSGEKWVEGVVSAHWATKPPQAPINGGFSANRHYKDDYNAWKQNRKLKKECDPAGLPFQMRVERIRIRGKTDERNEFYFPGNPFKNVYFSGNPPSTSIRAPADAAAEMRRLVPGEFSTASSLGGAEARPKQPGLLLAGHPLARKIHHLKQEEAMTGRTGNRVIVPTTRASSDVRNGVHVVDFKYEHLREPGTQQPFRRSYFADTVRQDYVSGFLEDFEELTARGRVIPHEIQGPLLQFWNLLHGVSLEYGRSDVEGRVPGKLQHHTGATGSTSSLGLGQLSLGSSSSSLLVSSRPSGRGLTEEGSPAISQLPVLARRTIECGAAAQPSAVPSLEPRLPKFRFSPHGGSFAEAVKDMLRLHVLRSSRLFSALVEVTATTRREKLTALGAPKIFRRMLQRVCMVANGGVSLKLHILPGRTADAGAVEKAKVVGVVAKQEEEEQYVVRDVIGNAQRQVSRKEIADEIRKNKGTKAACSFLPVWNLIPYTGKVFRGYAMMYHGARGVGDSRYPSMADFRDDTISWCFAAHQRYQLEMLIACVETADQIENEDTEDKREDLVRKYGEIAKRLQIADAKVAAASFSIPNNDDTAAAPMPAKWTRETAHQLRPEQRRALAWMKQRESNPAPVEVSQVQIVAATDTNLCKQNNTDLPKISSPSLLGAATSSSSARQEAAPATIPLAFEFEARYKYNVRGGILADKIGFGKTATMLSLIASQEDAKAPTPPIPEAEKPFFFDLPSTTLILVPSHLVDQWKTEVEKFVSKYKWKVLLMKNVSGLSNYTPRQLREYDVIISTYKVLYSSVYAERVADITKFDAAAEPAYFGGGRRAAKTDAVYSLHKLKESVGKWIADWDSGDKTKRAALLQSKFIAGSKGLTAIKRNKFEQSAESKSSDELIFPVFEACYFKRVVLDEFHETEALTGKTQVLMWLRGRYRWGMTGTPSVHDVQSVKTTAGLFGIDIICNGARGRWCSKDESVAAYYTAEAIEMRRLEEDEIRQRMPRRLRAMDAHSDAVERFVDKKLRKQKSNNPNYCFRPPCLSRVLVNNAKNFIEIMIRQNSRNDAVDGIKIESHSIEVKHTPTEKLLYINACARVHADGIDFASHLSDESLSGCKELLKLCSHFSTSGNVNNSAEAEQDATKNKALSDYQKAMSLCKERIFQLEAIRRLLMHYGDKTLAIRAGWGCSRGSQTTTTIDAGATSTAGAGSSSSCLALGLSDDVSADVKVQVMPANCYAVLNKCSVETQTCEDPEDEGAAQSDDATGGGDSLKRKQADAAAAAVPGSKRARVETAGNTRKKGKTAMKKQDKLLPADCAFGGSAADDGRNKRDEFSMSGLLTSSIREKFETLMLDKDAAKAFRNDKKGPWLLRKWLHTDVAMAKGYYPLLHVGIPNGVELWTEDEAWRETPQGRRFGLLRDQIKAASPQGVGSALLQQQQMQKMTTAQKQADAKKRVAVLREELSQVQRELSTGLGRVRETFSAYHFFTNAIKVFTRDPAESECAICMEAGDVAPGGIAITSCGHIFCQDCIKANIAQACQCPYCRKPLPKAEPPHLYALQDQENTMQEMEAELEKAAPDEDVGADEDTGEEGAADDGTKQQSKKRNLDKLLLGGPDSNAEEQAPKYDQYGTKIRRICETLRQIKNDFPGKKAIVFCQWLELENKIADSFRTYGFRFSQLKGTAYQKNNIITAFQNDEEVQDGDEWFPSPEILLMSLETAASGANLTKASHVLFVHPMLGSSLDDSTAYETQAIGRIRRMGQEETCVHVYRFYTRDTVEEKLHHAHLAHMQSADSSGTENVENSSGQSGHAVAPAAHGKSASGAPPKFNPADWEGDFATDDHAAGDREAAGSGAIPDGFDDTTIEEVMKIIGPIDKEFVDIDEDDSCESEDCSDEDGEDGGAEVYGTDDEIEQMDAGAANDEEDDFLGDDPMDVDDQEDDLLEDA